MEHLPMSATVPGKESLVTVNWLIDHVAKRPHMSKGGWVPEALYPGDCTS